LSETSASFSKALAKDNRAGQTGEELCLRDEHGRLLRKVTPVEAASLVARGIAEPVGGRKIRHLRVIRSPRLNAEASMTTRRTGISFEHIGRRCSTYGGRTAVEGY